MEYFYTARFLRSLKKLLPALQDDVIHAVRLFESGDHETLKLHKLKGRFMGYSAFSVNFSHRIIVKIEKASTYYMDVGSHDIYEKK